MTQPDPVSFLPQHLQKAARKLPKGQQHTVLELKEEGSGHNASLITVASICFKMGVSFEDTLDHLQSIYSSDRIDHRTAPKRAVTRVWEGDGEIDLSEDHIDTPDAQEDLLIRFRRTPANELVEASPHKTNLKPIPIIRRLFKPTDIINIQQTGHESGTLLKVEHLDDPEWQEGFSSYKFLNPSTFKNIEGVENPLDPEGKVATRCNANVLARRYMVLELDSKEDAELERFTTFALTMSQFAPLVLAVDTGKKSIHFWFDKRETPSPITNAFFAIACLHGADKALGVKSQIARMPNVSSAGEGRGAQRVLYFDPEGKKAPDKWNLKGFEEYITTARQLDYFYHKKNYYMQGDGKQWVELSRTSMLAQLAEQGFRMTKLEGEVISPAEAVLARIEREKSVDAVMRNASGRHAGFYDENSYRFLVLKSPVFIKPRKGDWSTIRSFLEHMFGDDPIQLDILYGWTSSFMKDLRNDGKRKARISPGQFLAIIAERDAGKTFLLRYMFPYLFGGRVASADPLFSPKGSDFNSEMFGCELLTLDDTDVLESTHKARTKHGDQIKNSTVGGGQAYHGKHTDRVPVMPCWRIIRVLNEEPEQIGTLPTLENGVEDKIILLLARSMEGGPIDKDRPGWFVPFLKKVQDEMEAFVHFLLEEYIIPEEAIDPSQRYAVQSYKHPKILDMISEDSPESYLLHRLQTSPQLFEDFMSEGESDGTMEPWEGSAHQLYDILSEMGSRTAQMRFRSVCPTPKVLVSQLRVLESSHPKLIFYSARGQIKPSKKGGQFYWHIKPPKPTEVDEITEDECF